MDDLNQTYLKLVVVSDERDRLRAERDAIKGYLDQSARVLVQTQVENEDLRAGIRAWGEELAEDVDFITRGPTDTEEALLGLIGWRAVRGRNVTCDGDWEVSR